MYPWQLDFLDKMQKYKGRGALQITGRQTGKSVLNNAIAYKRILDDIYNRPVEDIKLSEGTVYGARYYTAEVIGGSWHEMEHWCHETFGELGDNMWGDDRSPKPAQRWYMNNRKFWFRNESDLTMFVMKWR